MRMVFPRLRRSMPASPWLTGLARAVFVFFFFLLPLIAWIEERLLGPRAFRWVGDWLCGFFSVFLMGPLALFHWSFLALWIVLAVLLVLLAAIQSRLSRVSFARRLSFHSFVFATVAAGSVCLGPWCFFVNCQKGLALVLGSLALLAARQLERRIDIASWLIGWCLLGFAPMTFIALAGADYYRAEAVPHERIFTAAAYDADYYGDRYYICSARHLALVYGLPGAWKILPGGGAPQRTAPDRRRGRVLFPNITEMKPVLTILDGEHHTNVTLPLCRRSLSIALDEGRSLLVAACDNPCSFQGYDLENETSTFSLPVPAFPYATTVDPRRDRAYFDTYVLNPYLWAVDLPAGKIAGKTRTGYFATGLAVEERSGRIHVALMNSDEIMVYEPDLRLAGRIAVGVGPRDLAIDEKRGLLLAGNYFSGTVSVIDPRSAREIRRLRIGRSGLARRLRGVSVGDDGAWLVSDRSGVWRIDPAVLFPAPGDLLPPPPTR